MMAGQLTISEMEKMIERYKQVREHDVLIPQGVKDRLESAGRLLDRINHLPVIDYTQLKTQDDLELVEGQISEKNQILEDFKGLARNFDITAGQLAKGRKGDGRREKKTRQPRRTKEQMVYDRAVAEITREQREKLGLPFGRGLRLTEEQQAKLTAAVEKEVKRQKLTPPKE